MFSFGFVEFGVNIGFLQTHLTFGKDFTLAVEMKQVAQQEAERARFLVEKVSDISLVVLGPPWFSCVFCSFQAEQKKKATVISAEGDSEGARLMADAFGKAGEALVELRKIEAAEDIAYQLSRSKNITYLPSGQHALLNLPAQ